MPGRVVRDIVRKVFLELSAVVQHFVWLYLLTLRIELSNRVVRMCV